MSTKSSDLPSTGLLKKRDVDVLAVVDGERHLARAPRSSGRRCRRDPWSRFCRNGAIARVVGEVVVEVAVDADHVGVGVVEHAEAVGRVAVAVDVAADLAAGHVRARLVEGPDLVRAGRQLPLGLAVLPGRREDAGAGRRLDHRQPGGVAAGHERALGGRVGRGEGVDDLVRAGGGLLQRRVQQVDAGVQDADGDARAVPVRVRRLEVDRAGLVGRHVRVVVRRRAPGAGVAVAAAAVAPCGVTSGSGTTSSRSTARTLSMPAVLVTLRGRDARR